MTKEVGAGQKSASHVAKVSRTRLTGSFLRTNRESASKSRLLPLTRLDGTMATCSKEKAQFLPSLFTENMRLDEQRPSPPRQEQQCVTTVTRVEVTKSQAECLLRGLDTQKATGPDNINPHLFKQCAQDLVVLLTRAFSNYLQEQSLPSV